MFKCRSCTGFARVDVGWSDGRRVGARQINRKAECRIWEEWTESRADSRYRGGSCGTNEEGNWRTFKNDPKARDCS